MEKEAVTTMDFCTTAASCAVCAKAGTCDLNGVNKLTVFDIFAKIPSPASGTFFPFVEVRFKNTRKEFYHIENNRFYVGMPVLVEAEKGYDLGIISAAGETARLIFKEQNKSLNPGEYKKVYRAANQKEIDLWQELRGKEEDVKLKAREIARGLGLVMKISDVEYQADGSKVTFYYTAEERVDFRELIKILAKEFSTRIEMRQIGYRQEAARLGGIGSCGRELCCTAWLTDFRSVSTQAAKYQQLALNPGKLTGQCGKLKCCLNFELDAYKSALSEFPDTNILLRTEKGEAKSVKVDVFKKMIWYAYTDEEQSNVIYKLDVAQVNEIIALNRQNKKSAPLEIYADELKLEAPVSMTSSGTDADFDSITRFDEDEKNNKNHKKRGKNKKTQHKSQSHQKKRNKKRRRKVHVKKKNNNNN
jgi:cell fate regulator YaaT (PSP1 superfamily)